MSGKPKPEKVKLSDIPKAIRWNGKGKDTKMEGKK